MLVASRGWKETGRIKQWLYRYCLVCGVFLFVFHINIVGEGGMSDLKAQNLVCVVEVILNGTGLHSFKVI